MFGHAGKILRVNLRKKEVKAESLRESFTRGFLGGIGFATKLFTEVVNPMVDPLSSENELIFMVGPLTGTRAPMCSRHVVVAKSPLTNAWGQSDAGGYWAAELKFAGFDGIILDKVADEPLYLWVNDGTAELFNASDIWGLDTYVTEDALKREHGERVKVLSIGPAGEKLVRIASLMNDKGRAAGRRGLGAVMGSKRLKAIAVKGSHPPEVYDEEMLSELQGEIVSHLLSQGGIRNLMEYGTAYPLRENDLPLKNWLKSNWEAEKIEGLSGKRMKETIQVGRRACYGCPVGCERVVQVKQTPYAMEEEGRGIEYEGIAAMGSLCLNCNLNALAKVNDIANRCGIDVITAGTLIAFTMEIYERGLITKEDLGMEIDWGDADAVIELVRMIAERRGFGNVLAEGPKRVTEIIGKGSGEYMPQVKGDVIPMHDPRTYLGKGLMYAICPYGPDHSRGSAAELDLYLGSRELGLPRVESPTATDVARSIIATENLVEVIESLVSCYFEFASYAGKLSPDYIPKLLYAVTGQRRTLAELLGLGSKLVNIKRTFNRRAGLGFRDDFLPRRFKEIPRYVAGKAVTMDVEPYLAEYYRVRGWR